MACDHGCENDGCTGPCKGSGNDCGNGCKGGCSDSCTENTSCSGRCYSGCTSACTKAGGPGCRSACAQNSSCTRSASGSDSGGNESSCGECEGTCKEVCSKTCTDQEMTTIANLLKNSGLTRLFKVDNINDIANLIYYEATRRSKKPTKIQATKKTKIDDTFIETIRENLNSTGFTSSYIAEEKKKGLRALGEDFIKQALAAYNKEVGLE